MEERYFVEYSVSQQCFHIDIVKRVFEINTDLIQRGVSSDFQVIGIFNTYEKAEKYVNKYKKELKGE